MVLKTTDVQKVCFPEDEPLPLDCGSELVSLEVAYQTYGELNEAKSNAIMVCHALTGDQFAADLEDKAGWWRNMVGPGKTIDTNKYYVICSNIIGGCAGSTSPNSINPTTGKIYGLDFPVITIADMVRAQVRLVDYLGVKRLFCVAGASMGGMQVLEWASTYSERVFSAIPIATAAQESTRNIAFHEVCRQAIMADPDWREGRYIEQGVVPKSGLSVARMAAHINYLSAETLHNKFGRNLQDRDKKTFGFEADFQVESYLRYQGEKFVGRFDANTYLYITRAIDYFDMVEENEGQLANAFKNVKTLFCLISFSTDWLQPTAESKKIVRALNAVAAHVSFVEIETENGHDAFLLDEPELFSIISGFLKASAKKLVAETA